MKIKIYLAIVFVTGFFVDAIAQSASDHKSVNLSKGASLTLPSSARLINSDQARTLFLETRSKSSKIHQSRTPFKYQIDGVLLGLADHKKVLGSTYLKDVETGLRSLYAKTDINPIFRQEKLNDNTVLIIEEESGNLSSITFIVLNKSHNASLSGFIEARMSEKSKARQILMDMLKTVNFN